MAGTAKKRPWLAALLAFVHPGLGHVYLREWARALLWFGLVLTTASLLVPESVVPATFSLESMTRMSRELPAETMLALVTITAMSMIDAYWIATRNNQEQTRQASDSSCPNCGRDVDPDLDFCHWCTARIDAPEEETDGPTEA